MSHSSAQPVSKHPAFEAARIAMVNSQLSTSRIITPEVLEAYRTVARELYVPADRQGVCYLDDDVSFGNGRVLIEPLVHALMVENAGIKPLDRVLDIGGVTGYSAAILSRLSSHVVALDEDAAALHAGQTIWENTGSVGIKAVCGAHEKGCATEEPFDVIVINGAVAEVPQALFSQLSPGGRLVCVVTPFAKSSTGALDKGVGRIILYTRLENGQMTHAVIADASVPYLAGFEPKPVFTF